METLAFTSCGPVVFQNYNAGHNILEHYRALVQFWFTPSKTELNNQYKEFTVKVASRAAEYLTQGLGSYEVLGKLQNWVRHGLIPSLVSRTKTLVITAKKLAKEDDEVLSSCLIFLDFFIFIQIFCIRLFLKFFNFEIIKIIEFWKFLNS